MSAAKPLVDIVIATVGRPTLAQAILAAAQQSYRPTRVVVLADGPCAAARRAYGDCSAFLGRSLYRTVRRHGHGDPVKAGWLQSGDAAPFVRFLDDDDWMPPESVELMMRAMEPGVSLVIGKSLHVGPSLRGASSQVFLRGARCEAHQALTATMLMRTEAAREAARLAPEPDDWTRAQALARVGRVVCVDVHCYWAARGRGAANWRWDTERQRDILEAAVDACVNARRRVRLEARLARTRMLLGEADRATPSSGIGSATPAVLTPPTREGRRFCPLIVSRYAEHPPP